MLLLVLLAVQDLRSDAFVGPRRRGRWARGQFPAPSSESRTTATVEDGGKLPFSWYARALSDADTAAEAMALLQGMREAGESFSFPHNSSSPLESPHLWEL